VWELRDGKLQIYPGNYSDYLSARQRERQAAVEAREPTSPERARRRARRQAVRAEAQRQKELETLIDEIDRHEIRLAELSQALATATETGEWEKMQGLNTVYAEHEAKLSALIARWERVEAG